MPRMPFDNLDHCILDDDNYGYYLPERMESHHAIRHDGKEPWHVVVERDRNFGWLNTDVARMMRTVFDRRVKALGITRPQWLAIVRLNRRPGASQSELADMMEIERAPAGKIVDRLEERGWVIRRPDPVDRRVNRIFLTDRGQRVYAVIWPIAQATVGDALGDLTDSEILVLTELLSRVKSRLGELAESDSVPETSVFDGLDTRVMGDPQSA
ncbi:MAG: MarR family winged helix-turn-helix transcriptional regulator [Hyphomicrobiaceae bacterium]